MEEHFDTGGDHLPGWRCCAEAALEAALPSLAAQVRRETAEQIAAAIEERGDALAFDCLCYDGAADLARQIGEAP
jgi:hypothetical protein